MPQPNHNGKYTWGYDHPWGGDHRPPAGGAGAKPKPKKPLSPVGAARKTPYQQSPSTMSHPHQMARTLTKK